VHDGLVREDSRTAKVRRGAALSVHTASSCLAMDENATFYMDAPTCLTFKLTRDQLKATDFLSFVQKMFREHPDCPMFKIVPPSDWSPTQRRPNLDELTIQTPIKQLVRPALLHTIHTWRFIRDTQESDSPLLVGFW
jgi:hypothetical protein